MMEAAVDETQASVDMRPKWKRQVQQVRHDPWKLVMDVVGDRRYGNQRGYVPTDGRSATRESPRDGTALVAFVADDGSEMLLHRMYPTFIRECIGCPAHTHHPNQMIDHGNTCADDCPPHDVHEVRKDRVEGSNYGLSRAESRWVARFILGWMAADWFGLRRAIYYYALHRHVAGFRHPK